MASKTGKGDETQMPRVVVNTQNYMFADMIKRTLESGDFSVTAVDKPEKLLPEFNRTAANIVLMEVTGYTPWKIEERMKLRGQIRQNDPACKIAFLVDEKAEPAVAQKVRRAKTDGLIDQFIYTSISASYLLGVMETI